MDEIIERDLASIKSVISDIGQKINGRTFLVTGGAGFIGSWVCEVLIEMGGNVICVDNLSTGSEKNIKNYETKKNFKFFNADIKSFDFNDSCDYVIHLAAIPSPLVYLKQPIETLDTSITGTRNILEIARKSNVKGFLFASTSEVYGNPPDEMVPTPETFFGYVNPVGVRASYYEGKRIAETFCMLYMKEHNLPIRIARIFNTYGPRLDFKLQSSYGRVVINFVRQALDNKPVEVFGDGKQTRSFCYITDTVVGLLRLLLLDRLDGEIVNIGNEHETTINELAQKIISITGSSSHMVFRQLPEDDPLRRAPDISKAKKLLGYNPQVSLDDGLMRTVEWTRKNP